MILQGFYFIFFEDKTCIKKFKFYLQQFFYWEKIWLTFPEVINSIIDSIFFV